MKRIKAACITQTLCFSNHDGEKRQSMQKRRLYRSVKNIKRSWKRAGQSTESYQKKQMRMVLL